jgi:hypothetical protein
MSGPGDKYSMARSWRLLSTDKALPNSLRWSDSGSNSQGRAFDLEPCEASQGSQSCDPSRLLHLRLSACSWVSGCRRRACCMLMSFTVRLVSEGMETAGSSFMWWPPAPASIVRWAKQGMFLAAPCRASHQSREVKQSVPHERAAVFLWRGQMPIPTACKYAEAQLCLLNLLSTDRLS